MRIIEPVPFRFMNPSTGQPLCSGSGNFEYRGPLLMPDAQASLPRPPAGRGGAPSGMPAARTLPTPTAPTQATAGSSHLGIGIPFMSYLHPGTWFGCIW